MTDPSLFPDLIPADEPTPEQLGRGARRQRLIAARIASGEHPLGRNIRLHPDAARGRDGEGLRCGTCRWRGVTGHHDYSYPKCLYGNGIRATRSESTDLRAWWPACVDYERTI